MADIELLVRSKAVDLVASTARRTLQTDMGFASRLSLLQREDYWKIRVGCEAEAAADLARELAHKTKLFVNPNKHTCRIRIDGQFIEGSEDEGAEPGVRTVHALISFRDDEAAVLTAETLRSTLGYGEAVQSVTRGVWWSLGLVAPSDDAARRLAESIIVTKSVDEGLLVNPHSQEYSIV